MKPDSVLKIIQKYLLFALVAVYTVFVLTAFSSPYVISKEFLIIIFAVLAISVWIARTVVTGSLSFNVGKFDLGVVLLMVAYTVSAIVATPNKMEAFLYPGVATFILASGVVYFLINQLDKKGKREMIMALLVSGILVSIAVLFTQIGAFSKIPQLPALFKGTAFNTMGGAIPTIIYLTGILMLTIHWIVKEEDAAKKLFVGISAAVMVFGLVVLIKDVLPGGAQTPKFADFNTSWQVAIETLKADPLWGVGPGNYLTAFNRFRPLSYNQTDLWQVRFTTARDFYLGVVSEVGFAGLFALFVLLLSIYNYCRKHLSNVVEFLALPVTLVLFVFLPVAPLVLFLLFVLLAVFSKSEEKKVELMSTQRVPALLATLPIILGIAALLFFGYKAVLGEVRFQKAITALSANNAKSTYDLMSSAISTNPYVDRYHAALAQIDMALATSLASKKDLTDTDRSTITQLVQQAINEGKATVTLNPQRSGNWEILGQIYRSIMPFAQGADQFTIQTYTQAIALDPTNPNLRISLGGVYYALGRYDDAIDVYKLAVLAKPDLANSHYNLAIAYREKKDYDNAITEMNNVLSLVPKDSQDYTLAKNTLDDLQKKKPTTTEGTGTSLTTPQAVQESNITPPIELPQEATPPATNQ